MPGTMESTLCHALCGPCYVVTQFGTVVVCGVVRFSNCLLYREKREKSPISRVSYRPRINTR